MTIEELELIESEENVTLAYNQTRGTITCSGRESAVDRALDRIKNHRADVGALLRERQGLPDEPDIMRSVACNVPTLAVQRLNYVAWFMRKTPYYHPSEQELDITFTACEEGDEVFPDFALSFTIRKPDGRFLKVDRKGRVGEPSRYAPALTK
jgi:hypothetical protein